MTAIAEIVILDDEELESRLQESRRELFNLRFQLATGQLDNTARLGEIRRDIARMLTVLKERALAEARGEPIPAPAPRAPRRRSGSGRSTRVEARDADPEAEDPDGDALQSEEES
jgi:large subunit ribosomal protein L29